MPCCEWLFFTWVEASRILTQSLRSGRLADRVIQYTPSRGLESKGEGLVLGGIGPARW